MPNIESMCKSSTYVQNLGTFPTYLCFLLRLAPAKMFWTEREHFAMLRSYVRSFAEGDPLH